MARRRHSRRNPDLILLTNPSPEPPAAWGRFHLTDAQRARMTHAPDIKGVPSVVAALGLLQAMEFMENDGGDWVEGETIRFHPTNQNGPWLVMDRAMKRLWAVSRYAPMHVLSARAGLKVKAVLYYPTQNSGKYEAGRPYRHEFGEGGRLPQSRWPEAYPTLRRVTGGHRAFRFDRGRFHINERGIVG